MRTINVKQILAKYGLKPKASWSQNFLIDLDVIEAIAEAVMYDDNHTVVELGAGIGVLSSMLAKNCKKVIAVEKDRELISLLTSEFALDPVVEVMQANAAKLDWLSLTDKLQIKPVVVGNLPYHMAAPILFHLLDNSKLLDCWVIMVQKEMADRILAEPGSKKYGAVTIMMQRQTSIESVLETGPESFLPPPKVRSTVLRFWPREKPKVQVLDERLFARVVKGAFATRRKQLKNCMKATFARELSLPALVEAMEIAEIDPAVRAEALTIGQFADLADNIYQKLNLKEE